MRLKFRCGHTVQIDPDKTPSPICHCGERRVARVLDVSNPRFTGVASGPLVQTVDLPARAVNVADSPLRLKDADAQ